MDIAEVSRLNKQTNLPRPLLKPLIRWARETATGQRRVKSYDTAKKPLHLQLQQRLQLQLLAQNTV